MKLDNILVYRIGHLGDTLVSLPAFWSLREAYPKAKITLLSNSNSKSDQFLLANDVLPEKGIFDEWLSYPIGISKFKLIQQLSKLFLEIRSRKFDAIIYLMPRNRTPEQIKRDKFIFRLLGIKRIIGTSYLEKNKLLPDDPRPLPKVETEYNYLLNCMINDGLSVKNDQLKTDLLLSAEEISTANEWIKDFCDTKKKFIAVAPGSKWESKIWNEDNYADVISKLIEKSDIFPIIFGGPEDREKGERLISKWGTGANAAGVLNIRQAAAVLEKCSLYLGNDTGTMHLAASVKTACVAIFAAIDWEGRWIPFGNENIVFRSKVDCEGCLSPVSFNSKLCLNNIDKSMVYDACVKVLNDKT